MAPEYDSKKVVLRLQAVGKRSENKIDLLKGSSSKYHTEIVAG